MKLSILGWLFLKVIYLFYEHLYITSLTFQDVREVVLWLAAHHRQRKALEFFSREIAPAGTGMGKYLMLLNEWMNECFNDTPAQKTDRLLGVKKR